MTNDTKHIYHDEEDEMHSDRERLLRHRCGITKDEQQSRREDDNLKEAMTTTHNEDECASFLTPVIWCILITETAERFAYFGFQAVLVLYFTMELKYSESQAIAFYAYNSSFAYFTPLLGACLADGFLGRYRTILSFGIIYVIGLAVLTIAAAYDDNLTWKRVGSFVGLFLVCLGTGGIKPCVSAFGADQVAFAHENDSADDDSNTHETVLTLVDSRETTIEDEHPNSDQVRAFFNYFYFCINVGAVTSIAIVPLLRGRVGFACAFGVPCLFMIAALGLFLSKRNEYVHQSKGSTNIMTTFRITWWLLLQQIYDNPWIAEHCPCFRPGPSPLPNHEHADIGNVQCDFEKQSNNVDEQNGGAGKANEQDVLWKQQLDDAAQALHALPILAMFPIFWCLYDQQGSVWTLQATRMDLPPGIQAEQLNIVNPVQIMIFIPLFDRVIYPYLERTGWNISPLRRMSWGMLLGAAAFVVSGLVESAIQDNEERGLKVHVFWQLPQITIMSVGEILLSITGLEFAYATSPDRLKAFVAALFLSTTAFGDCLGGILFSTVFAHMDRAIVMHVCAGLMLVNLRLFMMVARWYEGFDKLQSVPEVVPRTPKSEGTGMELRKLRGEVVYRYGTENASRSDHVSSF
jgi:dipeptide/tripeptide permease